MADIEVVVKIPEHYYENNIKKELPIYLSEDNIVAILPKGHGRLIDFDQLCEDYPIEMGKCDLPNIYVIIKADKGGEQK